MNTRICKKCQAEKPYNYFTLNSQGRLAYKDDQGNIWHGRVCYPCFKEEIRVKAKFKRLKGSSEGQVDHV